MTHAADAFSFSGSQGWLLENPLNSMLEMLECFQHVIESRHASAFCVTSNRYVGKRIVTYEKHKRARAHTCRRVSPLRTCKRMNMAEVYKACADMGAYGAPTKKATSLWFGHKKFKARALCYQTVTVNSLLFACLLKTTAAASNCRRLTDRSQPRTSSASRTKIFQLPQSTSRS